MKISLEEILIEKDKRSFDGDLGIKYSSWLNKFSKQPDFLTLLSQKSVDSIVKRNFRRFNFIIFILQGHGNNTPEQMDIYSVMIDFINLNIEPNEVSNEKSEGSIELALDALWHQPEALKKINKENQIRLYNTLKRSSTFLYNVTENGEEPFFAIKKSMNLIVFQEEFGDSEELWNLFGNHSDPLIKLEYQERIKRL